MIAAINASLIYRDQEKTLTACDNVSLQIDKVDFVGILGPSGSGKSSLLYLLSGLKNPSSGQVFFEDVEISKLTEKEQCKFRICNFGFVFQQPYLIGYLSALENVMIASTNPVISREYASHLLEQVGLSDKMNKLPSELSGGEKQRVCVSRALVNDPKVLFADEPTASLDHKGGESIVALMLSQVKGTIIMVTHDPSMLTNANKIIRIQDGRILDEQTTR